MTTSLLQVLRVDEKSGISSKTGRPYTMHTAQCIVLDDNGAPSLVGVLDIPRAMVGKVEVGTFLGSFSIGVDFRTGKIQAELVGLQSYAAKPHAVPAPEQQPAKAKVAA